MHFRVTSSFLPASASVDKTKTNFPKIKTYFKLRPESQFILSYFNKSHNLCNISEIIKLFGRIDQQLRDYIYPFSWEGASVKGSSVLLKKRPLPLRPTSFLFNVVNKSGTLLGRFGKKNSVSNQFGKGKIYLNFFPFFSSCKKREQK